MQASFSLSIRMVKLSAEVIRINVTLRCNLHDWRTARGYTQDDLAAITGINSKALSKYENNERAMNVRTAAKLAAALGCTLDDLYEYEVSERR